MNRGEIMIGDVRERLAELADGSVHCVVTSPPYFGLRDYKIEPQVWGGDPACEHVWGAASIRGGSSQNQGVTSHHRDFIGIELSPSYAKMSVDRMNRRGGLFFRASTV